MFDIPLFRDHILENILKFNSTTLISRLWLPWLLIVAAGLALAVWILRRPLKEGSWAGLFYDEQYKFNRRSPKDWWGLLFLTAAFVITGVYVFSLENSLFESFDTMGFGTMRNMKEGVVPNFDTMRITPLAFWDLSTLYAVTHNIYMIKSYLLAQLALAVVCMYCFFNYIPVARRLTMLAVLLLTPTMLQTAQIIFPDREIIIAVMLSLICLRHFCRTQKFRWLTGFLFFMIVALYTKETCVLFYFGIVAASVLYRIWQEDITPRSFLHPWRTLSKMPLEVLLGIGLFSFLVIYSLFIPSNEENLYLSFNQSASLQEFIRYYGFELSLLMSAVVVLLWQMQKHSDSRINPMFRGGGLLVGGISVAAGVMILGLIPRTWHLYGKTYYLLLPTLFALAWLFQNMRNFVVLTLVSVTILACSARANIIGYKSEEGHYYRQVADFMAQQRQEATQEPVNIFLIERPCPDEQQIWALETWNMVYHYYFYPYPMFFKTKFYNLKDLKRMLYNKIVYDKILYHYLYPIIPQSKPQTGDWVIIHKQNREPDTLNIIKDLPKPSYENKLFEVYHAK